MRTFSRKNLIKTSDRNNLMIDTLGNLVEINLNDPKIAEFDFVTAIHEWKSSTKKKFL